jgi:colanic acid biosynthesis glycosyl transferase WcaI
VKLRIRLVHFYFHPAQAPTSQLLSELAFDLASRGHEVSVITSRAGYHAAQDVPTREVVEGVDVHRVSVPNFGRYSTFGRLTNQIAFMMLAGFRTLFAKKVDVVVLLTDPPFFALLGRLTRRLRRERFVHIVMDLYPDVAVQAEVIEREGLAHRALRWITRLTLTGADRVVVLGDCMRERVLGHGASPQRTVVVPNWADSGRLAPVEHADNPLASTRGAGTEFVVMYSGNMGVAHRFEEILEAAARLRDEPGVTFMFVGEGQRKQQIETAVRAGNLTNVLVLPYQPREFLSESLSLGDLHLVTLRPGFEGLVVPSKSYGIMAAGRPILFLGAPDSEIARVIRENDIGIVCSDWCVERLCREILALKRDRERLRDLGERARRTVSERFDRGQAVARYEQILQTLVERNPVAS